MARKHHSRGGQQKQLKGNEGATRIHGRHHEDLEKTFTDEQKEIFEKFHDCWDEYVSLAEAAIFQYTFKLGSRLIYEALCEYSE
jgi:hypothetical protein